MKQSNYTYWLIILFSIGLLFTATAQNQTANWYFGNTAGLSFNQGITNNLTNSAMVAPAGCASISNNNGDLLFYTNGETVWNSNHVIMENGNDLYGIPTHTQSSIIVPNPENDNIYYIFTTIFVNGNINLSGIYYSTVEFSNAFPLGQVINKNTKLFNANSERITAVYLPTENYYKVLVMSSEPYQFAFGVAPPPNNINTFTFIDVTGAGVAVSDSIAAEFETVSLAGAMKISPNGEHLAIADNGLNRVYLYNINAASNTITYSGFIFTGLFGAPDIYPYGIEFSEDSNTLYFTSHIGNTSFLYKYSLNSTADVVEKILVSSSNSIRYGDLQLAINGKIYVANHALNGDALNTISVINYPNKVSVEDSEYSESSVDLNPNGSFKGLPNFVSTFFENHIITDNDCVQNAINFEINSHSTINSVLWNFGDGNTSNDLSTTHQFENPGEYIVSATITANNFSTTLYRKVIAYALPSASADFVLTQCDIDNDGISIFNLNNFIYNVDNFDTEDFELTFFNTQADAINNTNAISNPENYQNTANFEEVFVRIVNRRGCITISNLFLEAKFDVLNNINTLYVCDDSNGVTNDDLGYFNLRNYALEIINQFGLASNATLTYFETLEDAQTDSNPLPLSYVSASKTIWVKYSVDGNCGGIGEFNLVVNQPLTLTINDTYQLCELNPSLVLGENNSTYSWEWFDANGNVLSNQPTLEITTHGNYAVTISKQDNGITCSISKDFSVLASNVVTFNTVEVNQKNITVNVTGTSSYEFSLDNVSFYGTGTTHTFYNVTPGLVNIYVRDVNNCEKAIQTQISFVHFPKFFTPNNDNKNDIWLIQGVYRSNYKKADVIIFDRYGKKLHTLNLDIMYMGWNGMYNGSRLPASDYWYSAKLVDINNKVYETTGNFTLKR